MHNATENAFVELTFTCSIESELFCEAVCNPAKSVKASFFFKIYNAMVYLNNIYHYHYIRLIYGTIYFCSIIIMFETLRHY